MSYRAWVLIWTFFSFVVANFGLNNLLAFSVPILILIYPVALVLIVMGISHDYANYTRVSYLVAAFFSVSLPFIQMLDKTFKVSLPIFTDLEKSLPLAAEGLSWLLPTFLALVSVSLLRKFYDLIFYNGKETA